MGLLNPNDNEWSNDNSMTYEEYLKSERGQRFTKFLNIIERLEKNVDLDEISCGTREEIFAEIEKRHIDVSDIVTPMKYEEYKRIMLNDRVQTCPHIGRPPEKVYDLHNPDDRREFEQKMFEERKKRFYEKRNKEN